MAKKEGGGSHKGFGGMDAFLTANNAMPTNAVGTWTTPDGRTVVIESLGEREIFADPDPEKGSWESTQALVRYEDGRLADLDIPVDEITFATDELQKEHGPKIGSKQELDTSGGGQSVGSNEPETGLSLSALQDDEFALPKDRTPAEHRRELAEGVEEIESLDPQPIQRLFPEEVRNRTPEEGEPESDPVAAKDRTELRLAEIAEKLAERAGVSNVRAEADAAMENRREPLREFVRAEQALKRFRIGKPTEEEQAHYEAAKEAYEAANQKALEAQLHYVQDMQDSVFSRIQAKRNKAGRADKYKTEEHLEKLRAYYNRRIREKEIIIPGVKQEQEVREEVLDEKRRTIFHKGLKYYKQKNEQLENAFAKGLKSMPRNAHKSDRWAQQNGHRLARLARIATFAAIGTGVGVGVAASALGVGPAAAVVGGAVLAKLGYLGLSWAAGTIAGQQVGKRYLKTKGAALAGARAATHGENIISEEELRGHTQAYEKGNDDAIEKSRAKRENITAALVSFGFGAAALEARAIKGALSGLHEFFSAKPDGIASHVASSGAQKAVEKIAGAPDTVRPPRIDVPEAGPKASGIPGQGPETVPAYPTESMSVSGKINNADKLFGHFRDQLRDSYPDISKAPKAVQAFLKLPESQDALTLRLGLQDAHGFSAVMHKGDTLAFEDGKLVLKPVKGAARTIIDRDGSIHGIDMAKEDIPTTGPVHHEAHTAPTHDAASEVSPDSELLDGNTAAEQIGGEGAEGSGETTLGSLNGSEVPDVQSSGQSPEAAAMMDHFKPKSEFYGSLKYSQTPQRYIWHPSNDEQPLKIIVGGSPEQSSGLARAYVTGRPGEQMTFIRRVSGFLGIGRKEVVSAWVADEKGVPHLLKHVNTRLGSRIEMPSKLERLTTY